MDYKKQVNLFGLPQDKEEKKYSSKVEAPVYEPKGKKPHLLELYDKTKTNRFVSEIKSSNISDEEKQFLVDAAKRHTVFNYERVADYYAHASKEMQGLMEQSALVIIDFDKAIEEGYVRLCKEISSQYLEEYSDAE